MACARDRTGQTSQGLMVATPIPSKSRVLRVSAVTAINQSTVGRGRPVRGPGRQSDAQRRDDPPERRGRGTMPQVLREPLFELRASLTLGETLYSLLNFRERDDAHMLGLAVRGLQPALNARVGTSRPVVFGQDIRID